MKKALIKKVNFAKFVIKSFVPGVLVFAFTSCTTIIHQNTVRVSIYTDVDSATVNLKDSSKYYVTPAKIDILRSKSDIELIVKKDSVEMSVFLKSRLSTAFWLGNLFNGSGILGYAIDLSNPKRFTYPENNYISLTGSKGIYKAGLQKPKRWYPAVKNQINFKFSLPESNFFYLNRGYGYGSSFGFLGISAGLEYYISDRYSINSDIGVMMDFVSPFPASVKYVGSYRNSIANYMDLQVGRDISSFHLDFGIQGNKTKYSEADESSYIDSLKYPFEQYNLGLALSGHYKISNGFNLGLNYYPSLFAWNNEGFDINYSHLIMFELIFKLSAYRPKK